jgi:hypothetical protein
LDHAIFSYEEFGAWVTARRSNRLGGRNVGWAVEEEFDSLWHAAALHKHQGE